MKLELITPSNYKESAKFASLEELKVGTYTIPKGSITDGATFPKALELFSIVALLMIGCVFIENWFVKPLFLLFWSVFLFRYFIPAFGRGYYESVLLHDFLLDESDMPREQIDRAMKEVLESSNTSKIRAFFIYRFARLKTLIS